MDPIEVLPSQLIFGTKRIQGWLAGIPTDSEDTLRFAEMAGARPMIEKYPLVNAAVRDGNPSAKGASLFQKQDPLLCAR